MIYETNYIGDSNRLQACSRRKFIQRVSSLGAYSIVGATNFNREAQAASHAYPPRPRLPNPYVTNEGKPILAVVYGTDFEQMLKVGLETIGGLTKLINDNQCVLIKPSFNAVDSYPAISSAESIAILAKTVVGVTRGLVWVGDVGFHPPAQVVANMGVATALAETGAYLVDFTTTYKVRRSSWSDEKPDYDVYSEVYYTPVVINLACLKRHFLAKMSAALKNNVGTVPGINASSSRNYLHSLTGNLFLEEIAEIAGLINPELTIVDARSILVGNGPFSSMPGAHIVHDVNRLIIGSDMVAIDLYCSRLLETHDDSYHAEDIHPTITRAGELGLGVKDLTEVEIIEISTTDVEITSSSIPKNFELSQNYPNPFNADTRIKFKIMEKSFVTLEVRDSLGREITTLINEYLSAGDYSVDVNGSDLASGSYFYQLRTGDQVQTKKMTLLK